MLIDLDSAIDLRGRGEPDKSAEIAVNIFLCILRIRRLTNFHRRAHTSSSQGQSTLGIGSALEYGRKKPMPQLHGNALELYERTWSEEYYVGWDDAVKGPEIIIRAKHFQNPPAFRHMPYHDVESFFWVLFWTLIRSAPSGASDLEIDDSDFVDAYTMISKHQVGSTMDCRQHWDINEQETSGLHTGLHSIGSILVNMWDYVNIEWIASQHDGAEPPQDHAHEAMIRILLQEIVRLEESDPVAIKIGCRTPKSTRYPGW
jgi:hypothetical protein